MSRIRNFSSIWMTQMWAHHPTDSGSTRPAQSLASVQKHTTNIRLLQHAHYLYFGFSSPNSTDLTCEDALCPFSRLLSLKSQTKVCQLVFGISQPSVSASVAFSNLYYGGERPTTHRVLYVNGETTRGKNCTICGSNPPPLTCTLGKTALSPQVSLTPGAICQ